MQQGKHMLRLGNNMRRASEEPTSMSSEYPGYMLPDEWLVPTVVRPSPLTHCGLRSSTCSPLLMTPPCAD
jgi:hypothetical protein